MTHQPPPVLVVEDDETLRELLAEMLVSAGYCVYGVADGQSALDAVARHHPGLILLDLVLPDMDGEALAEQVRSRLAPSIPIIVVSAAKDGSERAAAMRVDGYLDKPFDYDELLALVQQLLPRPG